MADKLPTPQEIIERVKQENKVSLHESVHIKLLGALHLWWGSDRLTESFNKPNHTEYNLISLEEYLDVVDDEVAKINADIKLGWHLKREGFFIGVKPTTIEPMKAKLRGILELSILNWPGDTPKLAYISPCYNHNYPFSQILSEVMAEPLFTKAGWLLKVENDNYRDYHKVFVANYSEIMKDKND